MIFNVGMYSSNNKLTTTKDYECTSNGDYDKEMYKVNLTNLIEMRLIGCLLSVFKPCEKHTKAHTKIV